MRNRKFLSLLAVLLIITLSMPSAKFVHAAPIVIQPVLVNTILTSQFNPPSPDPSGLAYNPSTGMLFISDCEVDEMPTLFAGKNVFVSTLSGQVLDSFTTTTAPLTSYEPSGLAYNSRNNHMFFSDDNRLRIFEDDPGIDGRFNTADDVVRSFLTSTFQNTDPEGLAYDSWHNNLILTSGLEEEIYIIDPGPNGLFEGTGDDILTHFDTTALGLRDPESVEFNSDTGDLFILSALSNKIGEVTLSGEVLRYIDISAINGLFEAGLAYAPGSNNPAEKHLYIVARGVDNTTDPNENDGKLYEISFPLLPPNPTPTYGPTSTKTPTLIPTETPIPTSTLTPSPTVDPSTDFLFADGFEGGTVSAWTASFTNGGNLAVASNAALSGNYGLSANITSNTAMYVEYNHPGSDAHYRARFYFDVNSIAMAADDSHVIFYGYSNARTPMPLLRIELRRSSTGHYQLRLGAWNDSGSWVVGSFSEINDAPHFVEFDYQAATAADANNGYLTLWIDGVQKGSLTGLDNDTRLVDFIRMGPLAGIDAGTSGVYYFDAFEAHRTTYIGPVALSTPAPTNSPTLSATATVTNTFTATPTSTNTFTLTPTKTSSPTATATHTLTVTPTSTNTFTVTPTNTLTPTNTPIPTDTSSPTATKTLTATYTLTPTATATHTLTVVPTWTNTATETLTSTSTNTPAPSDTPSPIPTDTLTATHTLTPTATATHTLTVVPTSTNTFTATSTLTPTVTITYTFTTTPTSTKTPTLTPTKTPTPTNTVTPSPTINPSADFLLADGFEGGTMSAWSASSTRGGSLAVTTNAALVGSYGLSATISSNSDMYVEYNHPGSDTHYRARFYFDVNSITMAADDVHVFFYGYANAKTPMLRIELRRSSTGRYQLRPGAWNDSGSWVVGNYTEISDAPHFVEFDYQAASGAGANNGYLTFWIDGVQKVSLTGLDNDTRLVDFIRMGPLAGIDAGTRGTYYFDAFEARHTTYIGPVVP